MSTYNPRFVWLDLETSGLDPKKCRILEVGCKITDVHLKTVAEMTALTLSRSWVEHVRAKSVPFVQEMHHKNGLWAELESRENDSPGVYDVQDELLSFIDEHAPEPDGVAAPLLCGASLANLEFPFLREYMPRVVKALSYRCIDVSQLREMMKMYRPDLLANIPVKRDMHRPMPDLEDSIALFRYAREHMLIMTPPVAGRLSKLYDHLLRLGLVDEDPFISVETLVATAVQHIDGPAS